MGNNKKEEGSLALYNAGSEHSKVSNLKRIKCRAREAEGEVKARLPWSLFTPKSRNAVFWVCNLFKI